MGAQTNNNFRTRDRKYDTYYPRNGSVRTKLIYVSNSEIKHTQISTLKPNTTADLRSSTSKRADSIISQKSHHISNNGNLHQLQTPRKYNHQSPNLGRGQSSQIALYAVKQADHKQVENYHSNSIYVSTKRKTTILQKMMYGFASLVIIFSAFVSVQSFITNNKAKEQIATLGENITRDEQGVSEGTGNEPSEEPISLNVVSNYRVSNPEDPRFLRIPSLGVFSRIKNLGVTPEGAVDAPRNIFDAGWYNGSARPGSRVGSSLILGHVSGWTGPGVFKKINTLPVGGEFEIEKGNGEIVRYSVVRSEQLPVNEIDMGKILSTEEVGKHDLKLMTCSGRYNSTTETYEDRFIVYAKRI
jgi:hypothetical protein